MASKSTVDNYPHGPSQRQWDQHQRDMERIAREVETK
jgi:hypothetical protein